MQYKKLKTYISVDECKQKIFKSKFENQNGFPSKLDYFSNLFTIKFFRVFFASLKSKEMSSIGEDRFLTDDDRLSKLVRRQTELEVVKSELAVVDKKTRKVFVGSGPGSVFFLSGNPAKVLSDVEKELQSVKKKIEKKSDAKKSSELNFWNFEFVSKAVNNFFANIRKAIALQKSVYYGEKTTIL